MTANLRKENARKVANTLNQPSVGKEHNRREVHKKAMSQKMTADAKKIRLPLGSRAQGIYGLKLKPREGDQIFRVGTPVYK